jgi:hypothetical protein
VDPEVTNIRFTTSSFVAFTGTLPLEADFKSSARYRSRTPLSTRGKDLRSRLLASTLRFDERIGLFPGDGLSRDNGRIGGSGSGWW